MILNLILILLFVGSLFGYSRLQLDNKLRAFLIGLDDPILKHNRFKYLMIHLNRMSPEYQELLQLDPFNKDLWDNQFFNDADKFWGSKLNLSPEQMASIREKKGYYNNEGIWITSAAALSSYESSSSNDSSSSDTDFGGGGGFDGGGAGGDF